MNKRNKALDYYDYLVKTNPNKKVELKFYLRVYDDNCVEASSQPFILDKECVFSVAEYVLHAPNGMVFHLDFPPFDLGLVKHFDEGILVVSVVVK